MRTEEKEHEILKRLELDLELRGGREGEGEREKEREGGREKHWNIQEERYKGKNCGV